MATNFIGRKLTANIAEQNVTLNMGFVYLIKNDSANVVTLSFEVASASATELMILNAGESRTNLDFPIEKLYYKAAADTSYVRIEGLAKKNINY
jgi:hypothetical protein